MSKADRISGFFWLFFGLIVTVESRRLGLGSLHRPGPGFLFFYTGIFVAIMALIVLIRAWVTRKTEGSQERIFGGENISKAVYVTISLFVYALLMEPLGFIPVTLLIFIFILGIIEKKSWLSVAITSVAITVASYLIFETGLQSQLPKGILGFFRF
jgi:putative tricarboxylic transport membrane protein